MHTYQNLSKYTKIWLRVKNPCAHLLTQKQLASIMGIYGGSLLLWSINVNHVMMPTDSKIPNDAKFECLQTAPVRLPAVQPANAVLLVSVLRDMSSYLSPATEVAAVPSYLWSHLSNWNLFIKSAMDVLRCKRIIIYCNCMIYRLPCFRSSFHNALTFKIQSTSNFNLEKAPKLWHCKVQSGLLGTKSKAPIGSYRLLTLCLYPCFHFTVDFWGPLPSAAFHAIGRSFAHKTGGANPVHQSIAPMQSSLRIKSWPCKSTTSGASSPSKARSSVERPNFSSTSSRSLLHRFWSFGASVLQISRRERAQLPKKFSLVKSSPNKSDGAWLSWVKNVRRSSAKSSSVGLNQENTWTGEGPPPRK